MRLLFHSSMYVIRVRIFCRAIMGNIDSLDGLA